MATKNGSGVSAEAIRAAVAAGKIEFIGTWEAAEILGVERPRIGRWLKNWRIWMYGDDTWQKSGGKKGVPPHSKAKATHWTFGPEPEPKIPKPIAETKSGPLWVKAEIVSAAEERRRQRDAVTA